jgi:HSP20 family molecular chaperone IbpA
MPRKSTWAWANGILLAGIVLLFVCWAILSLRRIQLPEEEDRNADRAEDPSERAPAPRVVDAGGIGVHPISFGDAVRTEGLPERWTRRGVQVREWDWLPASPGMDMTETPRDYVLLFSLPGVHDEDICMGITGRVFSVQAVLRNADGKRIAGMRRRVQLPEVPGPDGIVFAACSNGILRVCVRK